MSTDGRAGAERRRPITVVLVDEDWMVRRQVAETLSGAGLEVVGEATNGRDAIEVVLDVRPDVVLIAIELPGISGVEAIQRLGVLTPACRLLVLTHSEQNRVVEAIVAGASGYILKSAPPQEIIAAVRATSAGGSVLSPEIAGKLLERIRQMHMPVTTNGRNAASAIRAALTERETQIFTRLASGNSDKQIAQELSLSTNTVSNHVKNILAKLQLENRIQAAVQAVRAGIS
jgi:DNA-binding NarL/FixJ family response regulator